MTLNENLYQLTATKAANLIAKKEISPVELVDALLDRIAEYDSKLQSFATVTGDIARKQAKDAEREILAAGSKSPMHGVPYGLKDIIDTAGIPTEAGSKVYEGRVPAKDAHVVRLFNAAGAIMIGKTVTTEFAGGHPSKSVNPWNAAHTPAGSSSGSGVAVAARFIPAALGTQTVGSVLRPAAYNGVVGFKPSFGRIGRTGVIPMSWSCDHVGILVRTVHDAALILNTLAGYDADDDGSINQTPPDFTAKVENSSNPPKVGFIKTYFLDESEEVTKHDMQRVAELIANAGATVEEVDLGIDFAAGYDAHRVVQQAEMAEWHQPLYEATPDLYQPITLDYMKNGRSFSAIEFIRANNVREQMRDAALTVLEKFDVLMMPTASGPATLGLLNTGDTRFQSPWSFTGLPSIALPTGLTAEGLPTSLQLIASKMDEVGLLSSAQWVEKTLGVSIEPDLR